MEFVGNSERVADAGAAIAKTAAAGRDALHQVREATGIVDADELPIDDYADLNVGDAVAAVNELTEPADIRTILHFEEAHKNRQRVISASENRIAEIAKEVVGVDS